MMLRYFLYYGCWFGLTIAAGCSQSEQPDFILPTESNVNSTTNDDSVYRPDSLPAKLANGEFHRQRHGMVEQQLKRRGIRDERVLTTITKVPRHVFVPDELIESAYDDGPLPIGFGQTISQPYIVALMTESVRPHPGDRALDIGTGCGYQAAILSDLVQEVYSIEIIEALASQAESRLAELGYRNVQVRHGDGYRGWPEKAPFDVIVVAAAPDHVPQPLLDQLALGGRLIIPVGRGSQDLKLIEKDLGGRLTESQIAAVRFVPMTGEAENR